MSPLKGRAHRLRHPTAKPGCRACGELRAAGAQTVTQMPDRLARQELESAHETLIRSESEWQRTFDAVPDLIAVINLEHRLVRVNKAMAERLGLRAEDCVGRPCHEIVHGLDHALGACPLTLTAADGREHSVEIEEGHLGGHFLISTTPILDEQGRMTGVVHVARDITERKRAEAALAAEKEWLAVTLKHIGDGVIAVDPAGRVTLLNDVAEKLTGWTRAEALGRPFGEVFRLVDEHSGAALGDPILEVLQTGSAGGLAEHPALLAQDGTRRSVADSASAIRDEAGRIVGAVMIFRDVSESKREQEERLRLATIVTASDDAILSQSPEGVITSWNHGAERLYGYSAAEAIGQPISMLAPPQSPELGRIQARLREGRHLERFETACMGKGGRIIDVSLTVSPIRDDSGRVTGAALIARDISDRKLAHESLRESREFLNSVIDSIGDPTFVKDGSRRFVLVNAAYCRFLGRSREEMLGKTTAEFVPPEQAEAFQAQDERLLETGRPDVQEMSIDDASGEARTVKVVKTIHTDKQGNRFIVGTFTDISAQKQVEEQLKETAKLRSDLISLVNHEYANVLTNMKLALALLKASEEAAPEETRKHSYEVLDRAVENLRSYTANFLNLHRMESGKFEVNIRPTAIRSVVLDALVSLRPLAEAKKQRLSVEVNFPKQEPVAVAADRDCLSLIVNNLITNAVKYTPAGGDITVRIALEGGQVLFAVEDTGIGIAPEEQKKIQEGFYRTQAGREAAKGFGFGLKVVSDLLGKHGSRLEVASEPGKGSRFSFRLPVWKEGKAGAGGAHAQ